MPTPSEQGQFSPPAPPLPEPKVNEPPAALAATAPAAPVPQKVPKPTELPEPQLSKAAIDKRLRRIVQPRSDGTFIIPEDFVKKYNGGERAELLFLFEKCGYNSDSLGYLEILFHLRILISLFWLITYKVQDSKG